MRARERAMRAEELLNSSESGDVALPDMFIKGLTAMPGHTARLLLDIVSATDSQCTYLLSLLRQRCKQVLAFLLAHTRVPALLIK